MASRARNRLSVAARGGQRLALANAARWNIRDELRAGISTGELLKILGYFDDALPDRLPIAGAIARCHQGMKVFGTVSLSTTFRFDCAGMEEKYEAAAAISASLIFFTTVAKVSVGPL